MIKTILFAVAFLMKNKLEGIAYGGFGGCTINLVSEKAHDEFIEQAKTKFLEKFGQEPKVHDVVISNGARKL